MGDSLLELSKKLLALIVLLFSMTLLKRWIIKELRVTKRKDGITFTNISERMTNTTQGKVSRMSSFLTIWLLYRHSGSVAVASCSLHSQLDRTGIWLNLNTFTLNNFGEEPWNLPSKADQNSQTTVKAWVVLSRE